MLPADLLLADFLAQPPRCSSDEWAHAGFRKWLADGETLGLHRCLGLPASPAGVRRVQRDRLLREAAAHIDGGTPWERAGQLHEQVRLFALRRWPVWFRLEAAPPHATPLQRALFDAFRTGAAMDVTRRQFHSILCCEAD